MSLISPVYNDLTRRPMELGRKLFNKPQPLPADTTDLIWLRVPFEEKDQAKKLGARWHPELRFWYAKRGPNLNRFRRWIKKR